MSSILDKRNKTKVQPLTMGILGKEGQWYGGDLNGFEEFTDLLHEFILNCPPNKLKSKLYWNAFWKGTEGKYNAGHKTTLDILITNSRQLYNKINVGIYVRACMKVGPRAVDFVCIADWVARFNMTEEEFHKLKIGVYSDIKFHTSILK